MANYKLVTSFIIFSILLIKPVYSKAQEVMEHQIFVNVGIGYSPGFDGDITLIGSGYPTGANLGNIAYNFTSITPNFGAIIYYNVTNRINFGVAGSYQTEIVNYQYLGYRSDEIIRSNFGICMLYSLNKKKSHFQHFIGVRPCISYWRDIPSSNNAYSIDVNGVIHYYPPSFFTFLVNPAKIAFNFQVFYAASIFLNNYWGFQCQLAIGQPYLAEGGLTFRIGNKKEPMQNSIPGHTQR